MSEYWLQKVLKPTRPWGPGLSNFCCLYNFNTARHWEIIYLKELWPNLASNAVCQCVQMYCFLLLHSCCLWSYESTSWQQAKICQLSIMNFLKDFSFSSFPANHSTKQLLAAGTTTINRSRSLRAKKGKSLLMVFLPKHEGSIKFCKE